MKFYSDEYLVIENATDTKDFLLNGKQIIDDGNYPKYYKATSYVYYGRELTMWKESSIGEVLATVRC